MKRFCLGLLAAAMLLCVVQEAKAQCRSFNSVAFVPVRQPVGSVAIAGGGRNSVAVAGGGLGRVGGFVGGGPSIAISQSRGGLFGRRQSTSIAINGGGGQAVANSGRR